MERVRVGERQGKRVGGREIEVEKQRFRNGNSNIDIVIKELYRNEDKNT